MSNPSSSTAWVTAPAAALCAIVFGTMPAAADAVADFYAGKQINLAIGTSPGGDYDQRGRMLARYMGKHIPGQPTIVPRNMPGGVGLQAANWLYVVAPKDGTSLHMVMQSMPMHQILGGQGVQFDAAKFGWIGNTTDTPNTIATWHTTGVKSIEDAKTKEVVVGAPGTATSSVYYPMILNALVGTKFKIIAGYPGGNDVNLAMERGEVGGRGSNAWASWVSTKPDWLKENKIHILVQVGLKRHPDLLAEAAKAQRDLSPMTGEEVQEIVVDFIATPPKVVERTKAILDDAKNVDQVKK